MTDKPARNKPTLNAPETYTLIMLGIYSILCVAFFNEIESASKLIILNFSLGLGIFGVASLSANHTENKNLAIIRKVYVFFYVFILYDQVQHYIRVVNPNFYDETLIIWDLALFGVNPTEWIYRFASPALTEFFQFSYMTYYFIPAALFVELVRREDKKPLENYLAILIFSYYLSYLLYFIMPAVGPRFFIHDFTQMDVELPGLWLAETFRHIVNSGGNIPEGAAQPYLFVNRDCMPSGHTWISLVIVILAFKNKVRLRWLHFVFGSGIIISTVYLRYHYVVDVIAGAALAIASVALEPKLRRLFVKSPKKQV